MWQGFWSPQAPCSPPKFWVVLGVWCTMMVALRGHFSKYWGSSSNFLHARQALTPSHTHSTPRIWIFIPKRAAAKTRRGSCAWPSTDARHRNRAPLSSSTPQRTALRGKRQSSQRWVFSTPRGWRADSLLRRPPSLNSTPSHGRENLTCSPSRAREVQTPCPHLVPPSPPSPGPLREGDAHLAGAGGRGDGGRARLGDQSHPPGAGL